MNIGTREHAALANDAYQDRSAYVGKDEPLEIEGVIYKVIAVANNPKTDYQGTAYQRVDTGEVVIAHRGTESLKDGLTDLGMVISGLNNQLGDAMAFTEKAMALAKQDALDKHQPLSISVTGHSLGGCLTEATAARYNLPAETFNSYYGAAGLKDIGAYGVDVNKSYPQIVNHARGTDVAIATGKHLGEVRTYAPPEDLDLLRRGRYLEPSVLPANPLLTVTVDAHKMGNFLPNNDITGSSILTPDNEARAKAYQEAVAHYRQDVVQGRIDLHTVANRMPSPLPNIDPHDPANRLKVQIADAAVTTAAHAVVDHAKEKAQQVGQAAEQVGQAAVQGAKTIHRATEHAAQQVGQAIVQGAQAVEKKAEQVGQAAVQGAQAVQQATERTTRQVSQAVAQGAQAVEKKVEQVGQAAVQGAKAAAEQIEKGAHKVGQAAVQGAQAVQEKAGQVYDAARDATRQGVKAVERAYDTLTTPSSWFNDSKPGKPTTLLNDTSHPDYPLFKQAQAGVQKIDAQHGRASDQCSDNLSACLAVAARRDGLQRIDQVALGTDASRVFAADGGPRSPRTQITSVPTVESLNTPIAQSSQAWAQVAEQQATQRAAEQQCAQEHSQQETQQQAMARAV